MGVIFLFIDGVGLGAESMKNPLFDKNWNGFNYISGGEPLTEKAKVIKREEHLFKAVNATLGVEGLPQSGTGQTALFSGENASKIIGKHFGPFPHSGIKHLLREQSLFNKAKEKGKKSSFINAYPDIFFKKANERDRWSCTTLMTKSAGVSLNGEDEVKKEISVTAGLTQKAWREQLGINVPEITPEEAAGRLHRAAKKVDLLLHEYYLTDKAGHGKEKERAAKVINIYDRFLRELIENKSDKTTLVLCSDHGNIEDLSTKTHTRNSVPLFVLGSGAEVFHQAKTIMDVTPGILRILDS